MTFGPSILGDTARLAATVLLPTPPLPLAELTPGLHAAVHRFSYAVPGSSAHDLRSVMQLLDPALGEGA